MNIIFRAVAALLLLLLAACSQSSAPSTAPMNITATPGEAQVILSWDPGPNLTYWVYYQLGTSVSTEYYREITYGVAEPAVITGLLNGTQYAFLVTSNTNNSKIGPASQTVVATPRLVGPSETWTANPPTGPQTLTSKNLNGIAYGNTYFVTVGDAATILSGLLTYTSPDGVTLAPSIYIPPTAPPTNGWSPPTTLPPGYNADLIAVMFNGSYFVAMGSDGSIIYSLDTMNWTAGVGIGAHATGMHAITYGIGGYIAVGDGGAIYKNITPAISGAWTKVASGTTQNLYGVSYQYATLYSTAMYIAVGANGTLLTSPDGVTWTPQNTHTNYALYQLAYGASTYVAVGDAGTVVFSTDAVNWVSETTPTTQSLRTVCFGPDLQFIAAGTAGTILYSATGAVNSWLAANAGSSDLYSIVSSNILISNVFLAVGAAGNNALGR